MDNRGSRVGSGRKRKPLYEKLEDGNPGRRKLEVLEFTCLTFRTEMPPPREMLSATEKDSSTLEAAEIYEETWNWLNEGLYTFNYTLLERYAIVQQMDAVRGSCDRVWLLAKHQTTGNAMQSPYVAMSQNFMTQTNRLWLEIYQIIRENSATEFIGGNPQDDMMERLLTMRKGK